MIEEISRITGIAAEDILGTGRLGIVCDARRLYWKILRDNGFTLSDIGRLSGKSHCAVLFGVRRCEELLDVGDVKISIWYKMAKNIKR